VVTRLIGINQLSKIRYRPFVFNQWKIFWISDFDFRFGSVNSVRIKVSPRQNMGTWKVPFLTVDSPSTTSNFSQDLILLPELWPGRELCPQDGGGHCPAIKSPILSLSHLVVCSNAGSW
jgi:hypothetical protein